MDGQMFVRPADGLVVLTPEPPYTPLPLEGAHVPRTTYWLRALSRGDVSIVDAPLPPDAKNQ